MKKSTKYILAIIFAWMLALPADAQLTGVVLDKLSGDSIPFASLIYKGHQVAVAGGPDGRFSIERHNGWVLTVKAVGYRTQNITIKENTAHDIIVYLKPEAQKLDEVVVKSKRKSKYSRKNNTAVELMKRVVEAK